MLQTCLLTVLVGTEWIFLERLTDTLTRLTEWTFAVFCYYKQCHPLNLISTYWISSCQYCLKSQSYEEASIIEQWNDGLSLPLITDGCVSTGFPKQAAPTDRKAPHGSDIQDHVTTVSHHQRNQVISVVTRSLYAPLHSDTADGSCHWHKLLHPSSIHLALSCNLSSHILPWGSLFFRH